MARIPALLSQVYWPVVIHRSLLFAKALGRVACTGLQDIPVEFAGEATLVPLLPPLLEKPIFYFPVIAGKWW